MASLLITILLKGSRLRAALIGMPDAVWGEAPVAVIVARDGKLITADDIVEFCSEKLARYKIPKRVYFVDEFPLSGSGKVVKQLLKDEIQSPKHAR